MSQLVLSAQDAKQAGPDGSQVNGLQWVAVPGAQLPAPSQNCADSKSVPEQLAAAHMTEPGWKAHLPAESQVPVVPQPMLPWFLQVPEGSTVPGSTCVQVPWWFGSAQLWHSAQLAVPQQTFSTQLPVPHWSLAEHVAPRALVATQLPPLQ